MDIFVTKNIFHVQTDLPTGKLLNHMWSYYNLKNIFWQSHKWISLSNLSFFPSMLTILHTQRVVGNFDFKFMNWFTYTRTHMHVCTANLECLSNIQTRYTKACFNIPCKHWKLNKNALLLPFLIVWWESRKNNSVLYLLPLKIEGLKRHFLSFIVQMTQVQKIESWELEIKCSLKGVGHKMSMSY